METEYQYSPLGAIKRSIELIGITEVELNSCDMNTLKEILPNYLNLIKDQLITSEKALSCEATRLTIQNGKSALGDLRRELMQEQKKVLILQELLINEINKVEEKNNLVCNLHETIREKDIEIKLLTEQNASSRAPAKPGNTVSATVPATVSASSNIPESYLNLIGKYILKKFPGNRSFYGLIMSFRRPYFQVFYWNIV